MDNEEDKGRDRIEDLREGLVEAEGAFQAIRSGQIDAFVVSAPVGDQGHLLRASEHPYHLISIFESLTDAFFAVNREWRITYLNQSAGSIMGKPQEELVGLMLWDLNLPGVDEVRNEYQKAMEERLAVHFDAPAAIASTLHKEDRWFER